MEEDIKILEEFKKNGYSMLLMRYGDRNKTNLKLERAIENLIKGYRELEKQLDSSRKANELLNKTNNELRLEIRTTYSKVVNDIISKFNLGDEYIPKSKIKEKIEELETKLKVFEKDIRYCKDRVQARLMNDEIYVLRRCMDLLKELMEE